MPSVMEYGKIIAVTGMSGLYELLSSKNDGAIVRSLEDKNTKFVSSRVHNFSHLESIEVFTVRDNVNLSEIFHAMENADNKAPDTKDAAALKKYFETIFPDLDFERVYSSDLKKMVKWFSVLKNNQVEIKLTPVEAEETPVIEETIESKAAQAAAEEKTGESKKAPAKKKAEAEKEVKAKTAKTKEPEAKAPAKKKAEPEKEVKTNTAAAETKTPAKKAAAKKKTKE
jgi:hypothetical protein